MSVDIFLDSGAPTIYNIWARKKKAKGVMGSFLKDRIGGLSDDYSFLKSEEYLTYKKQYIDFLLQNKEHINIYANFDIINNAEATWENQLEFESYGLKPIPVFHLGEDIKWLYNLLDRKYEYIALGGIIPNPVPTIQPVLDNVWSNILTDKKGMPKVKVHGFGVTSPRLIIRYPWYSVDSSSWIKIAAYGGVVVPKIINGEKDYSSSFHLFFTHRKQMKTDFESIKNHYEFLTDKEKKDLSEYFQEIQTPIGASLFKKVDKGYSLGKNELWANEKKDKVEVIESPGLINDYTVRSKANALFYMNLQKQMPEWPWSFSLLQKGFNL